MKTQHCTRCGGATFDNLKFRSVLICRDCYRDALAYFHPKRLRESYPKPAPTPAPVASPRKRWGAITIVAAFVIALIALAASIAAEEPKRLDVPRTFMGERVLGTVQYQPQPQTVAAPTAPSTGTTVTTTTAKLEPAKPKLGLKFSDLLPVPYQRGVYYDTRPTAPPTITITTTEVKK